jgi:hypothetical protein
MACGPDTQGHAHALLHVTVTSTEMHLDDLEACSLALAVFSIAIESGDNQANFSQNMIEKFFQWCGWSGTCSNRET